MVYIHGFFMTIGMFSAIPCPYRPWDEKARSLMMVFLPLVGFIIGLIWYLLYEIFDILGLPLQLQAAALMIYPYVITGFIHLDGYMDTSDAILSRRPLEEKLRILKDPHTGAFAVISLAILFFICYAAISVALENRYYEISTGNITGNPMLVLILIPVITRVCSGLAVIKMKSLVHSQYHGEYRKKGANIHAIVISCIGLLVLIAGSMIGISAVAYSYSILMILVITVITYILVVAYATRQLGGMSGDLAGYALTIAEASSLVAMSMLLQ